jgi:hypothetical protein
MKPTLRVFLTALFLLILAGCGSTSSPTPEPTATPTLEPTATPFPTAIPAPVTRAEQTSQQSFVRLVQGSWDLPEVDIYIDGAVFGYNMNFGQVTEPQPLVSGEYMLRLMPAGVVLNSHSQEPIISYDFNLPAGETLTLIIGGESSNLNIQLVPEDTRTLEVGQSRLTFIHALHQGEQLGVKAGEDMLIAPIDRYQISHDVTLLDLNSEVKIVTAQDETIATYAREFRSRVAVTLIAIGDATIPESVRLVNYTTRVYGEASAYFTNAITDQPSIDVYLDGELVAGGLDYGTHQPVTLPPADYQLVVLPAGSAYSTETSNQAIYRAILNLYEDDTVSIVFSRQANRINHLMAYDNLAIAPNNQSRISFVHGTYDDGYVDVTLDEHAYTLYSGDVTRPVSVNAGSYSVEWSYEESDGQTTGLDVLAGNQYTVIYIAPDVEPVVIVTAVGEEDAPEEIVIDEETTPTPATESTLEGGALVYMLNLVDEMSVLDVSIGHDVLVSVPQDQVIVGTRIEAGEYEVQIRMSEDGQIFGVQQYSFRDGFFYTVYVVGVGSGSTRIYIFEQGLIENVFDETQGIVRFLNLSLFSDASWMIGLSDGALRLEPLTVEGEIVPDRYVVEGEYEWVTDSLSSGQITYPQYLVDGVYQFALFDAMTAYGVVAYPNLNVQSGMRYDVIIQHHMETGAVEFDVVGYPAP